MGHMLGIDPNRFHHCRDAYPAAFPGDNVPRDSCRRYKETELYVRDRSFRVAERLLLQVISADPVFSRSRTFARLAPPENRLDRSDILGQRSVASADVLSLDIQTS